MPGPRPFRRRGSGVPDGLSVLLGVGIIALCWMFLMPPGSGPDEPGHLVRAGAVIRGDLDNQNYYELPDRYQIAEPGCYAFQPAIPVTCSATPDRSGVTLELPTNAGPYPIWGHAIYGAPTVLPGAEPLWWARLAGAVIATILVGCSLVRSRRHWRPAIAGLLLGVTPMAWSTFATVNPSTFAIAGAVALWTGLVVGDTDDEPTSSPISAGWLAAIGWVALVLPRRDGLVWACVTLVIALAATGRTAPEWWRTLARWQQMVILASTAVMVVWGATSGARSTRFVVMAPLLIAATEGWRWWWNRPAQTAVSRGAIAGVTTLVGVVAAYVAVGTRPGGWDTDLAVDIVMQTDDNLVEAIGVLGWLDTVVPAGVVHLWLIALGMLVAAALIAGSQRHVIWATVLAGATILSSWLLELVQGNTSGTYWQGRYSIPLIVGIPLLLTTGTGIRVRAVWPVHRLVGLAGLLIVNIAGWAAARRFGVGIDGTLLPWRWDTPIQPIPPVVLLVALAASSFWLATVLLGPTTTDSNQG